MSHPLLRASLLLSLSLPFAAQAHKAWLEPSKTVLGVNQWVTVDAAASTDPFVKDHNPQRLDSLEITAPDGSRLTPENPVTGKLRSSFDLQLAQAGTYRIALVSNGLSASWEENGQRKMWPPRGQPFSAEGFAKEVPAKADQLKVLASQRRVETFVTAGKPSEGALKPSGVGLELQPISGVNDLYTDEPARFRFLLDGKPVAGLKVELIADGVRYRNAVNEIERTTGADGSFELRWPQPGLYWLSATVVDQQAPAPASERRAVYSATLEVLTP
ncbi:DUF4198 domain-containing protein [Stagnimonas aquatica]|uniref:DUF4198 domain-containing protein n=1 Tax=Stagnimonas aquatica TaxID=2689987 RepID=A0A3N0VGS3_9GAMM|nr:DUF4198 domain-containing protein [Stagnimonas aquatica]ROH91894.1 DUF4198 domain-containing protein [Stagnimonas aquatica]